MSSGCAAHQTSADSSSDDTTTMGMMKELMRKKSVSFVAVLLIILVDVTRRSYLRRHAVRVSRAGAVPCFREP